MAHPVIQAPAVRHVQRRSPPTPEGIPANVMPGDTAGVLPARPHGAATSDRWAAGPVVRVVWQHPP